MTELIKSKLLSRKLWFFAIGLGLATWLLTEGYIDTETWKSVFWACALGYSGGNVGEHFASR